MKRIILLSLLLLSLYSQAQLAPASEKWGLSFTPAIVPSPDFHYAIQPGVEYRLSKRISLLTEFAVALSGRRDSSALNSNYFRIKPELRYFFAKEKQLFQLYTGLQLSYSRRSFDDGDGGGYFNGNEVDTSSIVFDKARIKSPVLTASLQLGTSLLVARQLYVEMFAGMGVRNIRTSYHDVVNPREEKFYNPVDKIVLPPGPAYYFKASLFRFHSNLGIRLLYRFGNAK